MPDIFKRIGDSGAEILTVDEELLSKQHGRYHFQYGWENSMTTPRPT